MWVPETPTYHPSLLNNFILYFSFNGYGTKLWVSNLTYSKLSKSYFAYCSLFIFICTEQICENLFIYVQSTTEPYNKLLKLIKGLLFLLLVVHSR